MVDYLGHTIIPGKLVKAIYTDFTFHIAPFPVHKTSLKSFLGYLNVYFRFFKDFAKRSRLLTAVLKKGSDPYWEHPTYYNTNAFKDLKKALTDPPVFLLPKRNMLFMIYTDASQYSMGATLLQQKFFYDQKKFEYIGLWRKTVSDTERSYSATKRECISVV